MTASIYLRQSLFSYCFLDKIFRIELNTDLYLIKHSFKNIQSLVSSFLSNLRHFKMCCHSISDNAGVVSSFLFVFIYLVQTSWNCVLFNTTEAGHLSLDNMKEEEKTRKGHN
jgi:hypothetical protein